MITGVLLPITQSTQKLGQYVVVKLRCMPRREGFWYLFDFFGWSGSHRGKKDFKLLSQIFLSTYCSCHMSRVSCPFTLLRAKISLRFQQILRTIMDIFARHKLLYVRLSFTITVTLLLPLFFETATIQNKAPLENHVTSTVSISTP